MILVQVLVISREAILRKDYVCLCIYDGLRSSCQVTSMTGCYHLYTIIPILMIRT